MSDNQLQIELDQFRNAILRLAAFLGKDNLTPAQVVDLAISLIEDDTETL